MARRRTHLALAAALTVAGSFAAGASVAFAEESAPAATTSSASVRTVIPLPTVTVTRMCGARDDILTVDPAWLKLWGDKALIFPNSVTFQGGADGDRAKVAGMIREEYRAQYRWAGSRGVTWDSWLLYPGTVKAVVDRNDPCPVSVEAPTLTKTVRCGEANDWVAFADPASADQWRISSRTWIGHTMTVTLRTKRGYVGPGGATELEQDFIDTGACPA